MNAMTEDEIEKMECHLIFINELDDFMYYKFRSLGLDDMTIKNYVETQNSEGGFTYSNVPDIVKRAKELGLENKIDRWLDEWHRKFPDRRRYDYIMQGFKIIEEAVLDESFTVKDLFWSFFDCYEAEDLGTEMKLIKLENEHKQNPYAVFSEIPNAPVPHWPLSPFPRCFETPV